MAEPFCPTPAVLEPEEHTCGPEKQRSAISEILDRIGFGPGQWLTLAVACGVFFAEGMELLIVSLLTNSIAEDVGVPINLQQLMLFSMLLGALIGTILSGPFADLVGRQFPIIVAYTVVVFFGVVSSFTNSFTTMTGAWFFVGLGFGVGQPAALALVNEVMPEHWRLVGTACSSFFFGLGALLAVLMVMINDAWLEDFTNIEWRLLLRCSCCPICILGLVSIFALPESPSFLAANSDNAYARDILSALRRSNGKPDFPVLFRTDAPDPTLSEQLNQIFDRSMILSTLAVCATSLTLNFALYGSGYALPPILIEVLPPSSAVLSPTAVLVLTLLLAGGMLTCGTIWGMCVTRKIGIITCLMSSAAACVLFGWVTNEPHTDRLLLVLSCFGLCAGPAFGLLLLVQVSATMLPARSSATSVAACLAVGRIGAVAAPLVFDAVEAAFGRLTFFFVLALLELGSAVAIAPVQLSRPEGLATTCREP